tara:strand:+ start:92428 stop:94536 length:2109 start_codon:yes stop_codon:yes gene_type:complete
MQFDYSYRRSSQVSDTGSETSMSFSPDLTREPTFFRGELNSKIPFREAISALHDVVVADARYKPKDRAEYMRWLETQDLVDWQKITETRKSVREEVARLSAEYSKLASSSYDRMRPYYDAQQRYFDYLYKRDYDAWFVLDPVITVHPDEVFFECFSQDEASYGRLSAGLEVFKDIGDFACGTTNVDYSQSLYDEFQKIRSYKSTRLEVDPTGFEVQTTAEEAHKEVKIDLPDTWVRGFLQVSSAMTLEATSFDLHPMDLHNICFVLRRRKELIGPRSMRYKLTPGKPVSVIFEPWGTEVRCPRSIYTGSKPQEIRVWGRRRIHALERLIPLARSFKVVLLGSGMPSFYVADLGPMAFTLGLSGWTKNDWSQSANFDLMAPREEVDANTKQDVFAALKENWFESSKSLSARLGLDSAIVESSLASYVQAGRAIYDLNKGVYRVRELSRDPLPVEKLRFSNERESKATRLLHAGKVKVSLHFLPDGELKFDGAVIDGRNTYKTWLVLDAERRMSAAECGCNYYQQNKLYKGPCEHMLALRIAEHRGISDVVDLRSAKAAAPKADPKGTTSEAKATSSDASATRSPATRSAKRSAAPAKKSWLGRAVQAVTGARTNSETTNWRLDSILQEVIAEISVTIVDIADEGALIEELYEAIDNASPSSRARAAVDTILESDNVNEVYGDVEDLIIRFQGYLSGLDAEGLD